MAEELQLRIHGPPTASALIYLPGLHGDWTLVGGFRRALGGRVHFAEITYPRTLTWSLEDYASGVETALAAHGITRGWLLGESFSSQVVWAMVARKKFQIEGVILAGGFVRHPARWTARLAEHIAGGVSLTLLTRILFGYAKIARYRYRHSPEALRAVEEFIARRTELDRQAAKHRLHLVAQNDPCPIVRDMKPPLYALTGLWDPVVPWYWVRRWLRKNCSGLREFRIIRQADHTVLATAPEVAAEQVMKWMTLAAEPAAK